MEVVYREVRKDRAQGTGELADQYSGGAWGGVLEEEWVTAPFGYTLMKHS
jgi:hypothetical protein